MLLEFLRSLLSPVEEPRRALFVADRVVTDGLILCQVANFKLLFISAEGARRLLPRFMIEDLHHRTGQKRAMGELNSCEKSD